MLDYSAISALYAVIETQGFETAAQKLCITQSAISQRIKNLENYYGQPVLIRTQPYKPSPLGELLIGQYKRVMLLEEDLASQLTCDRQNQRISVAVSRDSLETWFVNILEAVAKLMPIHLEILADDQDVTLQYLKKGVVSACASSFKKHVTGCNVEFLGFFDYVLVASPAFKAKFFHNKKINQETLLEAPTVLFDYKDTLQAQYLKRFFNISKPITHYHVVPSVAGFRQFALNGYGYALIPEIDILLELKQKKLINLFPDKKWDMPVYWHKWDIETGIFKSFNEIVLQVARKILRQNKA